MFSSRGLTIGTLQFHKFRLSCSKIMFSRNPGKVHWDRGNFLVEVSRSGVPEYWEPQIPMVYPANVPLPHGELRIADAVLNIDDWFARVGYEPQSDMVDAVELSLFRLYYLRSHNSY